MVLNELLTKDYSAFKCEINNWEGCIEKVGEVLEKEDVMNHQYTKDMISLVKELGPYIVVTKNIAFAHARPNGNVNKNAIGLITLKEGVNFGNKYNDPVDIVFAIAAKSDEDHLQLFQILAEYLDDYNNIQTIRNATKYEDLNL